MEYSAPEIYDLENAGYTRDLRFYRRVAEKSAGPVLELGCGTGRLTIPLALSGISMTGLDISARMLNRAKEKARRAKAKVRWVRGDMTDFRLHRRYGAILLPFNSVQHLLTASRLRAMLGCIHRHLLPGGFLALDVYNPRPAKLGRKFFYPVFRYRHPAGPGKVDVWVRNRFIPEGINRVTFEHRLAGRTFFRERLRLRCYFPGQLDRALQESGFVILRKLGGFGGGRFSKDSPLQIFIAKTTGTTRPSGVR